MPHDKLARFLMMFGWTVLLDEELSARTVIVPPGLFAEIERHLRGNEVQDGKPN